MIAKSDRFVADSIRIAVLQVYPAAETVICATAQDALDALREERAQLGVVGLSLSDADGLDLAATIVDQALAARVLIFTGRRDERARRVLKSLPMCDFFDTSVEKSTALVPALQQLAKGLPYCSRPRPEGEPSEGPRRLALHQIFSARELEIFSVLGSGSDDHEAAAELGMTAATVKSHRARIMRKLSIQTRAELMREAVFRGVVRFGQQRVIRPGFENSVASRLALTQPRGASRPGSGVWKVGPESRGAGLNST
jgi:DNA-binding NarL/FixJ family response regulator